MSEVIPLLTLWAVWAKVSNPRRAPAILTPYGSRDGRWYQGPTEAGRRPRGDPMLARAPLVEATHPAPAALPEAPARSEERGLSLLTFRAWALLSGADPLPDDPTLAARAALDDMPLDLLGGRYAMFEPEVRRSLPATVIESWRFYTGTVEARGLGCVHVVDIALSAAHGAVYLVRTTTEEGEGYLEVYAADGAPLASGRLGGGRLTSWDERFGAVRDEARRLAVTARD